MAILNKIEDISISDTVEACFRTSIGGYCYPPIGGYLRGRGRPHYSIPLIYDPQMLIISQEDLVQAAKLI